MPATRCRCQPTLSLTDVARAACTGARHLPTTPHPPGPRRLPPLRHLTLVAAGGAAGAVLRVAFVAAFPPAPDRLPWVTLLENLTGAFLLAVLLTALGRRAVTDPTVRLVVGTGVLGSFTTYSTHSVEVVVLATGGSVAVAALYLAVTVAGGVLAALAGTTLTRRLVPERSRP